MKGVERLHTALKIVEKNISNMFLYVAFSENADPEVTLPATNRSPFYPAEPKTCIVHTFLITLSFVLVFPPAKFRKTPVFNTVLIFN